MRHVQLMLRKCTGPAFARRLPEGPGSFGVRRRLYTRVRIAARKWKRAPVASLKASAPAGFPIPHAPEPDVVVPFRWLVPVTVRGSAPEPDVVVPFRWLVPVTVRGPDVPGVVVPRTPAH